MKAYQISAKANLKAAWLSYLQLRIENGGG
jgi:hypothetical protein